MHLVSTLFWAKGMDSHKVEAVQSVSMANSREEASRVMLRGNNSVRQVSDMLWRRGLQPSMMAWW